MFYTFIISLVVGTVSIHIASYGWYAYKEEKNLRGAAGAFITAGITFFSPLLLIIYYRYYLN